MKDVFTTTLAWQDASWIKKEVIKGRLRCNKHFHHIAYVEAIRHNHYESHRSLTSNPTSKTTSNKMLYKAHRLPSKDPSANQVQAAYVQPGPSDDFTIRYIEKAAFEDNTLWAPSAVSKLLGYPLKVCVLDINDLLHRPDIIQDDNEPYAKVANRFWTDCDMSSEDFGTVARPLRGTTLMVCEDGSVPDLKFLDCMNGYIKKQLILVGNEVERLRKLGKVDEMSRYRESVKGVFSVGEMNMAWAEYQRREAEAKAKFEADKAVAEREAREAAEAVEEE